MFPHDAQKVLGCFGGHGFSATYHSFTDQIPAVFAVLAIIYGAGKFSIDSALSGSAPKKE